MVVVLTVVEPDESELHQLLHVFSRRVEETSDRLSRILVADNEEVRKYLDVEERDGPVSVFLYFHLVFRHEVHLLHDLQTPLSLIGRLSGEGRYSVLSIGHIISDPRRICIVQNLLDEVDARRSSGVHFLTERLRNESTKVVLILNVLLVNHSLCFLGQFLHIVCDRQIIRE